MKNAVLLVVLFALAVPANAQFKKGDFELTLLGDLGSVSWESTLSYSFFEGRTSTDDGTTKYAYLALTPGYYIIDGLSVELELGLMAIEKMKPAQHVIGNVSYTHTFDESIFAPFARIGYGVSNSIYLPMLRIPGRESDKLDIGILNMGLGLKIRLGDVAVFRSEINYKKQAFVREDEYPENEHRKEEISYNTYSLLLGFGVIL